ncbi:MAG: hypothetical protein N2317_04585 [Syntrophales bacterium]|nr:hypothetical protein [Syntrophales bacterium]
MQSVKHFERIVLPHIPHSDIYRRIGYSRFTSVSPEQKRWIDEAIEEALVHITLRGAFRIVPVVIEEPERILLPEGDFFASSKLVSFLGDVEEICLMGATAGEQIIRAIEGETARGNLSRAVVFDAVASEIVDASLDWIMGYVNQGLRREGKRLMSYRYSAGYGDFSLENQAIVCRLLELERLGVRLTERFVLVPEKSVTALTGIIRESSRE